MREWKEPITDHCITYVTYQYRILIMVSIQELNTNLLVILISLQQNITAENAETVVGNLRGITEETTDPLDQTLGNINIISIVLKSTKNLILNEELSSTINVSIIETA